MGKNKFKKHFSKQKRHNHKAGGEKFQKPYISTKRTWEPIIKNNLKEHEVGIEEFTSDLPGFSGIIKARFSDFHVNEIDLNGQEVKLTNIKIPEPKVDELKNDELQKLKNDLKDILNVEITEKIDKMLQQNNDKDSVDIDVTNVDKEKRTLLHKVLKQQYGNQIISSTVNENDKKFIKITKSRGKGEMRSRWLWPEEYTYFVIHKENVDTLQAAADLAHKLKLPATLINYAGTKDKRAKTSQLFCIRKREPSQIERAAKYFPYMKIGNFEFRNKVLKLGELKGNRFRIALRQVEGDEEKIIQNLENLKINGFINYYGLQRFGNSAEVPTYKIGISLLKSDYKEACELILKPREGDHFVLKEAREMWWKNRNSSEALSILGNRKCVEKHLLDGLASFGENDFATALKKIPRNMLIMYVHAFQSFIWNKIVSRRIKEFGLKLIPGDLVYKDTKEGNLLCNVAEVIDDVLAEDENISLNETDLVEQESLFKGKVRHLTENDILSDAYTIFDVVFPLPGYDITYPSNKCGEWYEEMLKEYDLTSEKLKHKVKTYSLAGSYRKILIKPENMKWQFKKYNSATSTLIVSDIEEINGIKPDEENEGDKKALLIDFILPVCSYATMALRELLKCDTSSANQAKLMEEGLKQNIDNSNKKIEVDQSSTISLLKKRKCEDDKDEAIEHKNIKIDS